MSGLILSIDQGTSGTKAILFDHAGRPQAKGSVSLRSQFPQPGFVEQDPEEIYANVIEATKACLKNHGSVPAIDAIGISNQRETFVLWDENGHPLCNAIVWQCKRSTQICERLSGSNLEADIRERTGLLLDPYFSGSKLVWLKENIPNIAQAIQSGGARFGTVESWLIYRMTNGKSHVTDLTNASRTLLFNLKTLDWDQQLIDQFGLTGLKLPTLVRSSTHVGETDLDGLLEKPVPITGLIGDSHAAAFGEGCHEAGSAKATLGTGSSILMNTGSSFVPASNGMVSTICWTTTDRVDYAMEGIIVSCGATIQWLRDQLGLIEDASQTEDMARSVPSNEGVFIIPAFAGLGAPYWKMDAKAQISGLTYGTTRNHIVRAALESVIFQIKDVIDAMTSVSTVPLAKLHIDGGMTKNLFVVNSLTDLLGCPVQAIDFEDISALGAAFMAGIGAGIYSDVSALPKQDEGSRLFEPSLDRAAIQQAHDFWADRLKASFG